jgi:hypothetical protein
MKMTKTALRQARSSPRLRVVVGVGCDIGCPVEAGAACGRLFWWVSGFSPLESFRSKRFD